MTSFADTARRALRWARSHSFIDTPHTFDNCWLLTGSGRSGTTWLLELLSSQGDLRPVFEPFHPDKSKVFKTLPFAHFIEPADTANEWAAPVSMVLTGQFRNPWSDQLNSIYRPRIYRGRAVKDIRVTPMTAWILELHPDIRAAHIIRNPYDVAASSAAVGWDWGRYSHLFEQIPHYRYHLGEVDLPDLETLESFERLILGWAIENILALNLLAPRGVKLAVYEELAESDSAIRELLAQLSLPTNILTVNVRKPSKTTRSDSHIRGASKSRLEPAQMKQAVDILRRFGLADVFGPDGGTDVSHLRSLWDSAAHRV